MKKYNEALIYGASLIESDLYNNGNTRLSAGLNLIGDKTTNERALGLGLKFRF